MATAQCKAANEQLMLAHHMHDFHDEGGAKAFKGSLWALRQLLRDTDGQAEGGPGASPSMGTEGGGRDPPRRRREPGMVVDVGANRGQSIETWASLFPGGNIILVEGNPSTATVLEGVVAKRQKAAASGKARGVAAVKVVRALVGNTTRVVTFRSSINGRSSELSGAFADGSPKVRLTEFQYMVCLAAFSSVFSVGLVLSWSCGHLGCAHVGPRSGRLAVVCRGVPYLTRPHICLLVPLASHVFFAAAPQKVPMDTLDNVLRVATRDLAANLRVPPHAPGSSPPAAPAPRRKYAVDLLKTDTEGWDVVAFAGAPATLAATRMVLWECHIKMATEGGPRTTHRQAAALLSAAGFDSYKLSAHALLRFDGDWYDARLDKGRYMGWHNCLAIRRDDPARQQVLSRLNGLTACVRPWGLQHN